MAYEDCVDYNGADEVWICNTGAKYDTVQQKYVYNEAYRTHFNYTSSKIYGPSGNAISPSADGYSSQYLTYLTWLQEELAAKELELSLSDT